MSISPRGLGRPVRARRRGFTLKESIAVVVIILVVLAIALPTMVMFRDRSRRMECESHLRRIGEAINTYASNDPSRALPVGAKFDQRSNTSSTSWWLDILPHAETEKSTHRWVEQPNSGDFGYGVNPNVKFADGYRLPVFFCPSSPLPLFNDPMQHMSDANRKQIESGQPVGIAVPMYTALAGSAPDMGLRYNGELDRAAGRNTNEGPWGILSASGAFPPNQRMREASILDQKNKTILVVEQSDYARDDTLDPPNLYDIRNGWPKGVFMGATGNYQTIGMQATDLNGDGRQRNWNITTLRYPLNTRDIKGKKGIYTDPAAPRPAKEGDPIPPTPPYPAEGYGPGHNNPIVSAHPEGANVLMYDGSVHFLNEKIDQRILMLMSTRDDGLNVPE